VAREHYKSVMRSQFALNPRYCSQCRQSKNRDGGREIAINGGMNARWICADCGAKHAP